ncbi:hypothetical protein SH2C18_22240 [Clostridium sediminicola]|uniref:Ig-like domain-containing protein n=1 Tax=Clostridium sediminicola TaxID=3114879 RepID=UPI0031F1D9A9
MKKSKKSLISAVTVLSSVATIVAPATTALADTTNGWAVNGQSWNYYNNGAMVKNGWVQDAGKWYLMGADGSMVTGWAQAGGVWYFMGANGAMVTNTWTQDSAKNWYYMGANGAMVANGWVQDGTSKKWYFMAANGTMEVNKWIVSGGFNYYMGATGSMLTDTTTPDGYKVLANGTWDGKGKEVPVPEKLEIKSVTSINAAQIQVKFNKALTEADLEEAEDLDNYTLNDVDGDEIDDVFASVDAEEGSDAAILTVDHAAVVSEDYENQTSYELVIGEDVVGKEVTKTFKVSDFEIPEAVSAEVTGIRTIKVTMTEPIFSDDYEKAFEVNDGDYSIEKVYSSNNGKEMNVVLFSDIKDGEELTVAVKSEAEDFAGYSLKKDTLKIKADFDTSALAIASYKKAEDNEITLVFNKDIKFADDTDATQVAVNTTSGDYKGWTDISTDTQDGLYHSSSKNKVEAAEIDGNELTLYFATDDELPETAYVYVDADVLEDLWETKNNDLFIKVNATKDQVKPEVKSVEQDEDSNDKIIIKFSEDIDEDSAEERDNYTVTDKNDDKVRVSKAEKTDTDEVTLTLSKDLENGDKYEVVIEDVEDKAGNKMSDATESFVAVETSAVTVTDLTLRYYDEGTSSQKIVVDFDTKMLADGSRYAIDNLDNYDMDIEYTTAGGTKTNYSINLSDYDDASVRAIENDNKVEIKLPGNDPDLDDAFSFKVTDGDSIKITMTISKVDDANENRTDIMQKLVDAKDSSLGLDDVDESPIAVDTETIKVVLEDEFDFDKNDIFLEYTNGSAEKVKIIPSTTKVTKASGVTTITYTLKESDQLAYNGKIDGAYEVHVRTLADPADIKSENSFGDKLVADADWVVMDEIAPELALIDLDATNKTSIVDVALDDRSDYDDAVIVTAFDADTYTATVVLNFEEKIFNTNPTKYLFETDDSKADVETVAISGKTITLTIKGDGDDYKVVDDFLGLGISTGSNEIYDDADYAPLDNDRNSAVVSTEIEAVNDAAVALAKIDAYAGDNAKPEPTVADYTVAGVTKVNAENLAAVNAAIDAKALGEADTTVKIQAIVDPVAETEALAKIDAYAGDNTKSAPTVADYTAAGVTGVTAGNLAEVNAAIDAVNAGDADTAVKIQAIVDAL